MNESDYKLYRRNGLRPIEMINKNMSPFERVLDYTFNSKKMEKLLSAMGYISVNKIWISPPSENIAVNLPIYQALRLVRKRNWHFTQVIPIWSIKRSDAINLFIKGKLGE